MKHLLLIVCMTMLFVASCKKEVSERPQDSVFLKNVKSSLKDSMSISDFQNLDFSKTVRNFIDDGNITLLRIPFKQKSIVNDFVLLQTESNGKIIKGRIVNISGSVSENHQYNGSLLITSLQRHELVRSDITNGKVEAFKLANSSQKTEVDSYPIVPDPYIELPEVIIVSTYSSGGGISWSTWVSLQSFTNSSGGGGSGWYSNSDPYGGGGGGGYGGGSGSGSTGGGGTGEPIDQVPIEFEAEYIHDLAGVNLTKMFNCFNSVPSVGATYKISLCSDIPSNNNPGASANFSAASGGHVFLTITKTNGSSSITQSFGFYPQETPSFWDPFSPIASEIKDNGAQEINASIAMNVTESQFNTIKQKAITWSSKKYELADYNCSDYAIDIFNSVRPNPLTIPSYQIILPGNTNPWVPTDPITITINKTPQMLFKKLQAMKNKNDPEAPSIRIDQSHNYRAPVSKGECN